MNKSLLLKNCSIKKQNYFFFFYYTILNKDGCIWMPLPNFEKIGRCSRKPLKYRSYTSSQSVMVKRIQSGLHTLVRVREKNILFDIMISVVIFYTGWLTRVTYVNISFMHIWVGIFGHCQSLNFCLIFTKSIFKFGGHQSNHTHKKSHGTCWRLYIGTTLN